MPNLSVFLALGIGAVIMFVPVFLQTILYGIKLWKSIAVTLTLTVVGFLGTYLFFFVENGRFGGTSFYGAIFFVPIIFLLFAKIINIQFGTLMNLCAPAECVMLAIMKIKCNFDKCCAGRVIHTTTDGVDVVFPSQMVEMIVAVMIFIALIIIAYKKKNSVTLYPIYMIVYGATRFVLNYFRAEAVNNLLPIGNVWSLVAIAIGVMWIVVVYCKNKKSAQLSD